jgi:hypothetical protein
MNGPFVLRATLTGLPVLFLLLVTSTGSVSNASSLLLLSVVCTAGIGGLFWLGMAFLLGAAVFLLVAGVARMAGWPVPAWLKAGPRTTGGGATVEALGHYADAQLRLGRSSDAIGRDLRRQGWREDEVARALTAAASPGARKTE